MLEYFKSMAFFILEFLKQEFPLSGARIKFLPTNGLPKSDPFRTKLNTKELQSLNLSFSFFPKFKSLLTDSIIPEYGIFYNSNKLIK